MLVPAILYKEEITKKMQEYFYTNDMLYVTGCLKNWVPNIVECPDSSCFQYAIIIGVDCYSYNLTRDKSAFECGTVTVNDFEEFNEEVINDIIDFIKTGREL